MVRLRVSIHHTSTLFSALFFLDRGGIQHGEMMSIGISGIVLNNVITLYDNIPHKCKPMITGICPDCCC